MVLIAAAVAVLIIARSSASGDAAGSRHASANRMLDKGAGQSRAKRQGVAFWLAWNTSIVESQVPWNAVTQVDLFALKTTNGTALDTVTNGINRINVPAWVKVVHQHHRLAIISIGGSNDTNWVNACNATNISGFSANLVRYMVSNGFDGVDLDIESSPPSWASCVRALTRAAHAVRTRAGATPIVSTDVDQSWMDPSVARFHRWPDQFNLMYYGWPVGSYNCGAVTGNGVYGSVPPGPANTCSYVNQLVVRLHNVGVPYSRIVLGMSPGGHQAQCCNANLATTGRSIDTGRSVTSIPLSAALSAAIPAGEVVLARGGSLPSHYQMFTTSGAAQGATSIPVTRTVSGVSSGAYVFPSGSELQNAYLGPWDCGNFARYAAAKGLEGVMIWDLQEEALVHHGHFPCFAQVAPYVQPAR
jgi:GH18 family chitinase